MTLPTGQIIISDALQTLFIDCDSITWTESQDSDVAVRQVATRHLGAKVDTENYTLKNKVVKFRIRVTDSDRDTLKKFITSSYIHKKQYSYAEQSNVVYIGAVNVTGSWLFIGWLTNKTLTWKYAKNLAGTEKVWQTDIEMVCSGSEHSTPYPYGYKFEYLLNGGFETGNAGGWKLGGRLVIASGGYEYSGSYGVSASNDGGYISQRLAEIPVDDISTFYLWKKGYYGFSPPDPSTTKITVYYTDGTTTVINHVTTNGGDDGNWIQINILSYLTAGKTINGIEIEHVEGSQEFWDDVTLEVS